MLLWVPFSFIVRYQMNGLKSSIRVGLQILSRFDFCLWNTSAHIFTYIKDWLTKKQNKKKNINASEKMKAIPIWSIYQKLFPWNFVPKEIHSMVSFLCRKMQLVLVEWKTILGTGNPASTGMLTGFLWSLKSAGFALLFQHCGQCLRNPVWMVVPDFNTSKFIMHFTCVVRVRMGYLAWVALRVLITLFISYLHKQKRNKMKSLQTKLEKEKQ